MSIKFSDIYIKHWILFDYDTSKSVAFLKPHHIFPLNQSIHFKTLKNNDFTDYEKLISSTKQEEHSVNSFKNLNKCFSLKKMEPIFLKFNNQLKKFLVEDGCHRLAIITHKNIFSEELPEKYIKHE